MSSLSLRLPDSLHAKLRELAEQDGVSINQFIATAAAEKAAALLTVKYLEERGRRADARVFDQVLARVPDAEPMTGDELPTESRQSNRRLHPTAGKRRLKRVRKSARGRRG